MEAAAHTTGGYGGVPQKVGREFVAADGPKPKSPRSPAEHMAKRHGAVKSHAKVANEFRTSKSTSHRRVAQQMRQGYTRLGKA